MSVLNKKLVDLLSDKSFVRWIKGTARDQERYRWEAWQRADAEHQELKAKAEMLVGMKLESDPANDVESQLALLNQKIDQLDQEKSKSLYRRMQHKTQWNGYASTVAAVMVLLVAVVSLIYFYYPMPAADTEQSEPLFTTVEVDYGETSLLKFSDGSTIRLNSKSSLYYRSDQFSSSRVEVWLDGEGYFDIEHSPAGKEREFIVHTRDGDVQVLGTKFNVSTRFQKTSVVLEEGRVRVSLKDSLSASLQKVVMDPGQRAVFAASSPNIAVDEVRVDMFTAWLDGEMEFDNTRLEEIIASIEATYGVNIRAERPELLERRISGTIQNPDLQSLLVGLRKILDLQIAQTNNNEFMISQ